MLMDVSVVHPTQLYHVGSVYQRDLTSILIYWMVFSLNVRPTEIIRNPVIKIDEWRVYRPATWLS